MAHVIGFDVLLITRPLLVIISTVLAKHNDPPSEQSVPLSVSPVIILSFAPADVHVPDTV